MSTVSVRYIGDDVEAAVAFYTTNPGFRLLTSALPAFADVARGDLRLLLSGPTSSGGRTLPDGRRPAPGGWNRIHLIVEDLTSEVERLRKAGLSFRSDIVTGPGGSQIVLDDSGNPVELFQPATRWVLKAVCALGDILRRYRLAMNPFALDEHGAVGEFPQDRRSCQGFEEVSALALSGLSPTGGAFGRCGGCAVGARVRHRARGRAHPDTVEPGA